MDIGMKLKNARITSHMTQEQVAESLGVSRQSLSNWENEKTYPDIINVVKLSELYSISLDCLLKENSTMDNDYLNYLDESTSVVKSKKKLAKILLIVISMLIWAVTTTAYWMTIRSVNAGGIHNIIMWSILPITFVITSIIAASQDLFGKKQWLLIIFCGVLFMLSGYGNVIIDGQTSTVLVRVPDLFKLPIGAIISVVGLVVGNRIKKK